MLTFQPLQAADFAHYYAMVGDLRVMAMITERALTEAEARDKFEAMLADDQQPGLGRFLVWLSSPEVIVGFGTLTRKKAGATEAEIGYMLLPAHWGKGYGGLIAAELITRARAANLASLFAIIDPANTASRRILIKNGFHSEWQGQMDGLPAERLRLEL